MKKICILLLFALLISCMAGCGKRSYVNYNETEPETPTRYPVYVMGGENEPYPLDASILEQVETGYDKKLEGINALLNKSTPSYEEQYNSMVEMTGDIVEYDGNLYISTVPIVGYGIFEEGKITVSEGISLFVFTEEMQAVAKVSLGIIDDVLIVLAVGKFTNVDWIDYTESPDTKFIRINNNTNFMLVNENNEVIKKDMTCSDSTEIQVIGDFFHAADVNFAVSYEDITNPDKLYKLEMQKE